MRSARVGIVIRAMDRPLFLARTIQSVLEQSFRDWLLVVVNCGEDTDSVENIAIQHTINRPEAFHFIQGDPARPADAVNEGISEINCEFLVVFDDSSTWMPGFLQTTVDYLEQPPHPRFNGVITHARRIIEELDGDMFFALREEPVNAHLQSIELLQMLRHNLFPRSSFIFRRSVFNEIGPFAPEWDLVDDWEFNVRFLMHSEIGVVPQPLVQHHQFAVEEPDTRKSAFTTLLRNHWLREDLRRGRFGLGLAAALNPS